MDDQRQADPYVERMRKERATQRMELATLFGIWGFVSALYRLSDDLDTQGARVLALSLATAAAGALISWVIDWMWEG